MTLKDTHQQMALSSNGDPVRSHRDQRPEGLRRAVLPAAFFLLGRLSFAARSSFAVRLRAVLHLGLPFLGFERRGFSVNPEEESDDFEAPLGFEDS